MASSAVRPTTILEETLGCVRETIRTEREWTNAEKDAFREFSRRIQAIQTTGARRPASGGTLVRADTRTRFANVKKAYEETVMAVSHYGEAYGESYIESVTEELGTDLASLIQRGTTVDSRSKRAILQKSKLAQSQRDGFLETLETERESVTSVESSLRTIVTELDEYETKPETRSFDALADERQRLEELADRCDTLAGQRQQHVHRLDSRISVRESEPNVYAYLYRNCQSTHPVLACIATIRRHLESVRIRRERALLRSV